MSRSSEALEAAKLFLAQKAAKEKESQLTQETSTVNSEASSAPAKTDAILTSDAPPEIICLLGKPGSGKSRTALTVLDIPGVDRAIALDVDKKMLGMECARKFVEEGRLKIINIRSPLIAGSLERRAGRSQEIKSSRGGAGFTTIAPPETEPKGYLEIMKVMDQAEEVIASYNAQAWITDSLTRCYEHMHRLISYMTKKGTLEESAWNIALMNGEEFVHAHMALPVRYVILTAHTRAVLDEKTGTMVGVEPEVQGSMRSKLLGYFGEAYYLDPTIAGVYRMCTRLTSFTPARTAKSLNKYEPTNLRIVYDSQFREEWYRTHKPLD